MTIATKAAGATLPISFDWSDFLADGETISSSSWAVFPTGELATSSDAAASTSTQVTLTAGNSGSLYAVTNTVTTSAGRIEPRSVTYLVLGGEAE